MSAADLVKLIGAAAMLTVEDLAVPVTISDARERWGKTDVLVSPIGGTGQKWVVLGAGRVTLTKGENNA